MGLGIARYSARFIAKSSNGRMGLSESSRVGSNPAFATRYCMRNFLILTEARCGYQFLSQLLNSNPEVFCLGEIFGNKSEVRKGSMFQCPFRTVEENEDPVVYLQNLYDQFGAGRVFGFKLHYVHAGRPSWAKLWTHIAEEQWNVIHLYRENLLDRLISDNLAVTERNWNRGLYKSQIEIAPQELQSMTDRSLFWREDGIKRLSNNPMLFISYEDLVSKQDEVCWKIQRFLGVTQMTLTANTIKQRVGRQRQYVSNYNEIYRAFYDHQTFGKWFDGVLHL
jgi:hypothetical protein